MHHLSNKGKHLELDERRITLKGIENGSDKTAIGETLGKNKSTIGKEIEKHRILTYKCKLPLEYSNYKHCLYGRLCKLDCRKYIPFTCNRRDRSPGACNGYSNFCHCRFNKYCYNPEIANSEYKSILVDSRIGVNLTLNEAKSIGNIVQTLLSKGISPAVIVKEHPELKICEKTLYNYIESGVLQYTREQLS